MLICVWISLEGYTGNTCQWSGWQGMGTRESSFPLSSFVLFELLSTLCVNASLFKKKKHQLTWFQIVALSPIAGHISSLL